MTREREQAPRPDSEWQPTLEDACVPLLDSQDGCGPCEHHVSWSGTVTTLLALQMGWGLWLMPADFARLGWILAFAIVTFMAVCTMYSGVLISRLSQAVPSAILFGDIGEEAAGPRGRSLVYAVIYSLDATRCIILHLAATQSVQHMVANDNIQQVVYGLIVAFLALLLAQVKTLKKLSWFFSLGTAAQLFAVAVVTVKLALEPDPTATHQLLHTGDPVVSIVAVMNVIFAYGGQFAFVEIIKAMEEPKGFQSTVVVSTFMMGCVYLGLGAVGYRSRGTNVQEIIIFAMGNDLWSRAASGAIFIQATAQYLVNLNVWTHNILTLEARRKAALSQSECTVQHSGDHEGLRWLMASTFVVGYSFGISMSLPFFSTLVGLVTSVCYLTCAYTIPCWFTLRLLGDRISKFERYACYVIIPLSLVISAVGFVCSVIALWRNIGGVG